MSILSVDLNNINLNDTNHNEDDPKAIIHARRLSKHSKFNNCKALKKGLNKELMLAE